MNRGRRNAVHTGELVVIAGTFGFGGGIAVDMIRQGRYPASLICLSSAALLVSAGSTIVLAATLERPRAGFRAGVAIACCYGAALWLNAAAAYFILRTR
jgi:hypothetical protein